ncbi:DUF5337 domain-containing protein [Paracoccus aerodenitrificans]|uniref:DUF5337 domain-containing protein n=1 Tax=Paracoccus aerodenitrificans TaxID=3017781 RepID=UPI0022F10BFC|nr:DUF5337 domain-containing protein [Paracoccus aerodenitrificans]WBU63189.1 DUF5337 domain-containing protein [Paracoccus aerodenitrificans]
MTDRSPRDAAQLRLAAIVMAATGLLWLAANWAGRRFGWPSEYAFLADLAAIGGFVWSLLVTWRIWRRGASPGKEG